jgi:D-sedoheptulose 7-phosphate isomerase
VSELAGDRSKAAPARSADRAPRGSAVSPTGRAGRFARGGMAAVGLADAGLAEAAPDGAVAPGPHAAGRADELTALLAAHVDRLGQALPALRAAAPTLARWGDDLGRRLVAGGRLLAAGNGGSAAEAQHLTAELVGRFDRDRRALSAIALHADTSTLSALGNDYGFVQVYARQVRAHARPGDVVVLFSTSGRSPNLVEAAAAAAEMGATSWALTGPGPNPLARACTDAVCLPGDTSSVQEMHLAALHMLCRAVEEVVAQAPPEPDGRRDPCVADRPTVVS